MSVIVSKFGGSSTAGANLLWKIRRIIEQRPERRYVVLSAPGADGAHPEKVTAMLQRCWRSRSNAPVRETILSSLADRFEELGRALGVPDMGRLARAEVSRALSLSEAHTLSRGEYLCARLFSTWSGIPMVDAAALIRFDDNGELDCETTRQSMEQAARTHPRLIIPGFYGAAPDGRIVTFPRNGSDITGALAAANMGASLYENWSDVPGLMTADPRVVPEARLIPQISYRQMRLLARSGARVLHPACLDPVALAGIPTRLRRTSAPENFGTLVDDRCTAIAPCVAGWEEAPPHERIQSSGQTLSELTVFGLEKETKARAAGIARALAAEDRGEFMRVWVERSRFAEAFRALHALLPT